MRETRPSGSEGGGVVQPVLPTPIALLRSESRTKDQGKIPRYHENGSAEGALAHFHAGW